METRIKTYGLIIGILLFVALVAGLSYAYYYSYASSEGVVSGTAGCFIVDYDKGNNINGNLNLFDEKDIINVDQIIIADGMQLTYVNAGINSACTLNGYLDIKINVSTLNTGFISGNSIGALKYVVAEYSPSSYSSPSVSSLNGNSFNILKSGSIISLGEQTIYAENLPHGSKNGYLIIFYIDGELAQNDVGNSSFSATISASATQGTGPLGNASRYLNDLYDNATKTSVVNNSITYQYDTEHSLMRDVYDNIRYYGKSPNNYIYFNCEKYPDTNCEKWRIIGVFGGKLKIMRNGQIGRFSLDTSASTVNDGTGVNEWSQADLMKLLNPGYDNETVGGSLYYKSGSGTCYYGQNNATTSCNFTSNGIKNDVTKGKIATVVWNTGGNNYYGNNDIYANEWYEKERGTDLIDGVDGTNRNATWTGKIALPYPSDYGYATDFRYCSETVFDYSSSNNSYACRGNDWIYPIVTNDVNNNGFLLVPSSEYRNIMWTLNSSGSVLPNSASNILSVIPTLYLNSTERISGGIGTSEEPYRLE